MIDDDLSTVNSALACHPDERTRAAWERLRAWATDAHKALRATALYRDGSETDMWPPQLELAARQLTRDLISSMTTDEAIANLTARAKWCRRWVAPPRRA